jgi:hypothetical protein
MASWFNEIVNTAAGTVVGAANQLTSFLNPGMARLKAAGLNPGGGRVMGGLLDRANVNYSNTITKDVTKDWRVRVSSNSEALPYSGVMSPLGLTQGVIFPYTPQIAVTHQANYTPQKFTHSNYPAYSYENSEVQSIQITADFTVQNSNEAAYLLACIYFFRSSTKMFFGSGDKVGNPPPLVFLDGYGSHYFPHVPCLVTQFSHTMPADVDYLETNAQLSQDAVAGTPGQTPSTSNYVQYAQRALQVGVGGGGGAGGAGGNSSTRIPTVSQITISLQPVYSKKMIAEHFSLESFSQGGLIDKGFL